MKDLKDIALFTLSQLKAAGADTAQCEASSGETQEFNVDGGHFSLFRTLFDSSLSLTAFVKNRRGTASLNKFDEASVSAAARSAVTSAMSSEPDPAWELCNDGGEREFEDGVTTPDTEKLFFRTEELLADIARLYPSVMMEQMIVSYEKEDSVYANSNGVTYVSHSGCYGVSLMYSAHDGEKASSFFEKSFTFTSLDKPFIGFSDVRSGLRDIVKQTETSPYSGKFTGTAILPPQCLGEFIGYAADNFAGERTVLDGTGIWKDKLGKKVASDCLTVSVSPLDKRVVCGERYTSEGFVSANYDFIKNGVLESFMISKYVANKTGNKRALNDSMTLVIEGGDTPYEDIIKNTKTGIIVGRFSGGEPSINGDFSGVAKNSFLVENGKITKALSETMISGNLAALLNSVIAISKETVEDGSSVLPTIAFGGVTVIGK